MQKSASSYSRNIPLIESRIEALKDKLDEEKEHLEKLEEKREEIFTELNNAGGNADNSSFNDKAIIKDYDIVNTTIATKEREISEKQRMVERGIIHWTLLIKNCPHTRRICQSKSTKILRI